MGNNPSGTNNIQRGLIQLLLAICTLQILPHIGHLKPLFIGFAFALLAWRAITLKFPKALPKKFILLPLSIGLGFLVLKTFGMSLGRDASSSLLIILMGLKLLESQNSRDVQAVVYMGFFVLITPFLFDQRIELALYGLVIFFMLLFALVINNTQSKSIKSSALFKLSGLVLLQAIPLMLVFFLLFPRMVGPLWAMPDDQSAVSGLSDTINPGSVSNLALSDETAFRVRFSTAPPEQKDLYWRGPVFWETNGKAWTLTPPKKEAFDQAQAIPNAPSDYQYTLMMEPHQQFWLYALDIPTSAPKNTRLTNDHQLILRKKLSRNISFDVRSSTQAHMTYLSEKDKERALKLSANTDPRIFSLIEKWSSTAKKPTDLIKKALDYYNAEFYYTLQPPSLGENPTADFLFDTKRGFCGHFATSFATLMRAAGIPARLVGGYQGGIYNKVGDFYNIRQADAHVWVEVWLEQVGWIRVDPTAAIAPNRIEHSVDASLQQLNGTINFLISPPEGFKKWAQQFKWMMNSIDYYWQNAVLAYGPEKQLNFLSKFGITDWGDMILWLSVLSGTLLLITITTVFIFHQSTPDPVQKVYLAFCKKLAKKAGQRYKYETINDYFNRVCLQLPRTKGQLDNIKQLYLKTRYERGAKEPFISAVKDFKF